MKKIFLIFVPFLFIACNSGYFTGIYEYEFVNNSSLEVSFEIENDKTYSLKPAETINIKKDHNDSYNLLNNPRATMTEKRERAHEYYYVYIENMPFVYMKIFNTSNYDIILSEKNGLLGDNYNDSLPLKAGEVLTTKVFTTSPEFSAVFVDTKLSANNAFTYSITY